MDRCQYDCKDGWYDDWDGHKGSNWCPCPIHNPDKKSRAEFKWGELGITDDDKNIDRKYSRMNWDDYFMSIVNLVRKRSHDSQTQHGAVAVRDNVIIATGFNGFPPGSDDIFLPNTRPEKYKFVNHAEESLIYIAAKNGVSLDGCTLYVSGQPCCHCARKLISVGITDWVIGPISHVSSSTEALLYKYWVESFKVKVRQYTGKVFE